MAYVKHTAIHTTPKAHLKYILNPDKNEEMKYVTGICCGDDLETAVACHAKRKKLTSKTQKISLKLPKSKYLS